MGLLDSFSSDLAGPDGQLTPAGQGLLATGLGILAHNRGLTSGTQAIGMGGLEGLSTYQGAKQAQMSQQMQNAQLQQLAFGLQKNKMLMNLASQYLAGDPAQGDPSQGAPAPAAMPAAPGAASPQDGPVAGPPGVPLQMDAGAPPQAAGGAPMQPPPQMPPQMPQGAAPPAIPPQGGAGGPVPGSPFGNMPRGLVAYGLMTDPGKLFENAAAQYSPTDFMKTLRAAGIDPNSDLGKQMLQHQVAVQNSDKVTALRGGGYVRNDTTGEMQQLPTVPEGFTAVQGPNGWQIVPVQGGTAAMTASSGAKAAGTAGYQLTPAWDPTANGGKGGMVQQTVANVASAANGAPPAGATGTPAPIANNNPGAMMPGGKLATYPTMQAGLDALDGNLKSYGQQGINTLAGVISKWAPPNENNTAAYIQDVSTRLGLKPDQPIDLSNPLVRHAISAGISLHENGPGGVFGQPGAQGSPASAAQPPAGPMAAAPPLGLPTAANSSQGAPSKLMADSYSGLSTADANYQQSRAALTQMMALANQKGVGGAAIGVLPSAVGTKISPDAAEYQKLHATYVSMQGKALGSGGTDASRANIDESVPTYDKPQSAMLSGLNTQLNNLDLSHLKTQFLTPVYQQGDEKAYTQKSAGFDQNVTPQILPILQMSGPTQQAAVRAAVKANPALRSNFEWAFNNGLLK
jgi:hypothetical protein